MPFKNGDQLKQKVVIIQGTVVDVVYNADSGHFQYLVEFTDGEGNPARRWFDQDDVEAQ